MSISRPIELVVLNDWVTETKLHSAFSQSEEARAAPAAAGDRGCGSREAGKDLAIAAESVLLDHDRDLAPLPVAGERSANAEMPSLGLDLRAYLEGKIAKWWMPDRIFFETVPMTATGKIDKKVIRDKYMDALKGQCQKDGRAGASLLAGGDEQGR